MGLFMFDLEILSYITLSVEKSILSTEKNGIYGINIVFRRKINRRRNQEQLKVVFFK